VSYLTCTDKRAVLRAYFDRYQPKVVVETGIWAGGGSCMQFAGEATVYLIDCDEDNCEQAHSSCPSAVVLCGDSADVLPHLLAQLEDYVRIDEIMPALFWLDAHYVPEIDGEEHAVDHPTPLLAELQAILGWEHAARSVVLVDDLRLLGEPGWPSRAELAALDLGETWDTQEQADILRLTPRG